MGPLVSSDLCERPRRLTTPTERGLVPPCTLTSEIREQGDCRPGMLLSGEYHLVRGRLTIHSTHRLRRTSWARTVASEIRGREFSPVVLAWSFAVSTSLGTGCRQVTTITSASTATSEGRAREFGTDLSAFLVGPARCARTRGVTTPTNRVLGPPCCVQQRLGAGLPDRRP